MKIEEKFKNPPIEFRSAPFWSWNDDLKNEELCRQIKEMKEKGIGGFFMHSRIGLITPYLSSEWMNKIKVSVDYARKTGMLAYLYDEDRWPSGFAGGIIPSKGEEYRIKALECKIINGKRVFKVIHGPNISWFNNYSYIDVLSKKVVKAFIESTYEAYNQEVGSDFGKTIPGIFTDEPNYSVRESSPKDILIPWTDNLPSRFEEEYGYKISEHLPSLFFNEGDYKKIRYDFWNLVTDLFLESYSQQIYTWCQKHNLSYTGHYLCEDNLSSQIKCIGAAMPHYEYMHIPGIDHLGRNIKDLLTLKQVSSVAHQLGRKRVLSELYGCSGQNFSFSGRKWIGDWHIVLGVNFFCPHLSLYSMRGERKRDCPPTIYYQQPWWKYNKVIEDYFARLNYIMSEGEFKANILVIHPIESAWCLYRPTDTKEVDKLNHSFVHLVKELCELHQDYDLADEKILKKYGKTTKDSIKVGRMSYKIVIIPPLITLRAKTFSLLKEFLANGGRIIAIEPLAYLIEGKEVREELDNFWKKIIVISQEKEILEKTLNQILDREISIKDAEGKEISSIYYHHRRLSKDRDLYFLVNTSENREFKTKIEIKGEGIVERWDPLSGKIRQIPSFCREGKTYLELNFPEVASHLLVKRKDTQTSLKTFPSYKILKTRVLPDQWEFTRCDPNALTLDFCQYKLEGEKWSEKVPVWQVQKKLEERKKEVKVSLRFSFQTLFNSQKKIYLILENPQIFEIKVNNEGITYTDIGWWRDISFKKIDISNIIKKKGENIVELSCLFIPPKKPNTLIYKKDGVELESIYITGDFAVEAEKTIIKDKNTFLNNFSLTEEKKVKEGNLVLQGYPFYAGSVIYRQKIKLNNLSSKEKVLLKFEDFKAIVAKVSVNHQEVGLVFWPPYEIEITSSLKNGENLIEIELTNSLRNLLGPHHHSRGELLSVGPGSFIDETHWVNGYNFVPFGLNKVKIYTLLPIPGK
ncbi:hypothetical protein J7K28_05935 [Candidatus Aerophobetes bacterium]|nr:hypothetical protein [Candidatus Aerophobetes bacterium]